MKEKLTLIPHSMWMPALAFFIFFFIFSGVLYFVLRPMNKKHFEKLSIIPLNDER